MERKVLMPDNMAKPRVYSQGIKVGNTIYVAGQAPFDQESKLVGKGSIEAQTKQTWDNVKSVLEAAGATMADIVKVTVYLKNYRENVRPAWEVRLKYFEPPYPASTGLEISGLADPDQLIEVDVIAVVD
jgi:reactive intermediate/imine deaminase